SPGSNNRRNLHQPPCSHLSQKRTSPYEPLTERSEDLTARAVGRFAIRSAEGVASPGKWLDNVPNVYAAFALLHQFKRLPVRWQRRTELHDAFVSLACTLIRWRRLKKHRS
ncbi:hypothetical protein ACIOHP_49775, partial [Streptomyces sp. NPDC087859]